MQEKKLCFQCERELLREPFYREWTKQFLSYNELSAAQTKSHKDLQISDSVDSRHFHPTQSRHVVKSPSITTPYTNRIYQSIMEGNIRYFMYLGLRYNYLVQNRLTPGSTRVQNHSWKTYQDRDKMIEQAQDKPIE